MSTILNKIKIGSLNNFLPTNGLYTFINPFSYVQARKKSEIFSRFDLVMLDGQLTCFLMRILSIANVPRQSFDFTSMASIVFSECQINRKTIYLIGAKPGQIEKAIDKIKDRYSSLEVVGARHGYFSNQDERNQVLDYICKLSPDVVIVGMGTPIQEIFLIDLAQRGWNGVGFTCGGFFHQTAGKGVKYYPEWMNKYHLRWLYRIIDEPSLFWRYLKYYPIFVVLLVVDTFSLRKTSPKDGLKH